MTDARARAAVRAARLQATPEAEGQAIRELIRAGSLSQRELDLLAYAGQQDAQAALGPERLHRLVGSMCSCRGSAANHGHTPLKTPPLEAWLNGFPYHPRCAGQIDYASSIQYEKRALLVCMLSIAKACRERAVQSLGCYRCESYFSEHSGAPCTCEELRAWSEATRDALRAAQAWIDCPCWKHAELACGMTPQHGLREDDWWIQLGVVIAGHELEAVIRFCESALSNLGFSEKDLYQIASKRLIESVIVGGPLRGLGAIR